MLFWSDSEPFFASIYDYKDKPYSDDSIHQWHIGGHCTARNSEKIVDSVKSIIFSEKNLMLFCQLK